MNKTNQLKDLAATNELTSLGVKHLLRYWQKHQLLKKNIINENSFKNEWNLDILLLSTLGLGIEQTIMYVYNKSESFEEFEQWILQVNNGVLNYAKIKEFNNNNTVYENNIDKILSEDDLEFWDKNGYIIIKDAINKNDCAATVDLICNFLQLKEHDASTWYNENKNKQGIMVQLFQDLLLEKNRNAEKIKKAFIQLWNRTDIYVNTDRVGFNPPETSFWQFPGPNLHWDVSLKTPIPFGTQGILYLTDTKANQGAFTLVPGFHNNTENWLQSLSPNTNPRTIDFKTLNPKGIEANAGDFIIWHQALPHGSSANTSNKPRFVQYINYSPLDAVIQEEWI